jgi:drug/metabolite transporter (DMT)-like permease
VQVLIALSWLAIAVVSHRCSPWYDAAVFRHPIAAFAALIGTNIVWSSAYASSKLLMEGPWGHISPLGLSFWRLLAATLIMLPLAWRDLPKRPLTRREWASLTMVGLIGSAGAMYTQFLGTQWSLATNASLITATETIFNCGLAALFLGERLDARGVAGMFVALFGVLLLNDLDWSRLDLLSGKYAVGNGMLLLSMLCYAAYSLAGKWAVETLRPMVVTAVPFAIATVALGLVCLWQDPAALTGVTAWSMPAWLGVLYMGVVVTALTYLVWNAVLVHATVSAMSLTLYVQPLAGTLLSWWWLGEHLSPNMAAGAVCVLAAVALMTIRPRRAGTVVEAEHGLADLSAGC